MTPSKRAVDFKFCGAELRKGWKGEHYEEFYCQLEIGHEGFHYVARSWPQEALAPEHASAAAECVEGMAHRFFPRSVTLDEPMRLTCIYCETKMDIMCLPASTGEQP